MNKIIKISLLLLSLPLLLTSCLKDDNDVFSEASSKRLQQALEETRSILRSSENGWVMDYYVGTNQVYGGYAFIVKFDSLTVTASSEVTDGSDTSYYKLTTDNGPVLSFDTYNDVLHALATPSASNYEAYHADYEFQIVSATADKVVLRGRRTGNLMQMHPLTTTPEEYLKKVAETEQNFIVASLSADVDGNNVSADIDLDNRQISFYSSTDSTFSHDCAFAYTDNGIRLYSEVDAYGKTLSDLSYDPETMKFTANDKGSEQLAIQGSLPSDYMYYDQIAGDYIFTFQTQNQDESFSDVNVDVTLEPNEDGTAFLMKGLINDLDITLDYDKSKGTLNMNTQKIGDVSGNELWLNAAYFKKGGTLYPGYSACGMVTSWNKDMQTPVLTWKTNDFEDMPTDSYCLWLMKNGESQGQYRDSQYSFAGYSLMLYVKSLTKKTPFPEHQK